MGSTGSNTSQFPTSLSGVDGLDLQHSDAITRAVLRLLDTELAVQTYGQIIDGVPLCDVARGQQGHRVYRGHPLENHNTLCPGVVDTVKQFRADFNMERLKFDTKLLEAFQAAAPNSRPFQLRLIELTAVTVHEIAVILHKGKMRLHDRHTTDPRNSVEQVTRWRRQVEQDTGDSRYPPIRLLGPWPTLFTHPQYCNYPEYPDGLADNVGYWAEDQIFGGVVLFDRSQPWNTPVADTLASPEPNFYLHPARYEVTRRLWQVKDEEQLALLDFMLSPAPASSSQPANAPLPLLPTLDHRIRIDPHYAMFRHKVYRDIWERPEPTDEDCYFWDRRPRNSLDYPELEDLFRRLGVTRL
ncbi:uncharacterized protein B0H64DRAFT_392019 [Chaetomium fimeti]|uniref:Uncharacterized protein n=1 Tax=Chaetomium fimeti TaxID=1854472 RepID=A0AAE0HIY1_9PEZI|nr:hypothetical protein B0H64DRAFT_392019 [Chaetomium fimeti]